MLDVCMKTFISIGLIAIFACLGFLVGREYPKSLKSPIPQIHIHYNEYATPSKDDVYVRRAPVIENTIESAEEIDCLVRTIYFEAGNQSYRGKLAVGYVVMNRVDSRRYPDTICGVISQNKQFSWYSKNKNLEPYKGRGWKDSVSAAKKVTSSSVGTLFAGDVQHYHADYVSPYWAESMTRFAQIDDHIVYRAKKGFRNDK